jgi:hypothetical protein
MLIDIDEGLVYSIKIEIIINNRETRYNKVPNLNNQVPNNTKYQIKMKIIKTGGLK